MIRVGFVSGTEWDARFPRFVAAAGLRHRLAVIQDTYVEGAGEMVFDEALWRTLIDFVAQKDHQVFVADNLPHAGRREVPLATYMKGWERLASEEREPPGWVAVRTGGKLTLCVITEYWSRVGGPQPYSDSYTYSLLSSGDMAADVIAWLRASPGAAGWQLGEVQLADDLPRPWWRRVANWLRQWL